MRLGRRSAAKASSSRPGSVLVDPERGRDDGRHEMGLGDGLEFDQVDAVAKGGLEAEGGLKRKPCLADAARTGQRHQGRAVLDEQIAQGRHLGVTPNERGTGPREGAGKQVGERFGHRRPQFFEVGSTVR